jgi:flagellar protein FliO/FliZ
VVARQPLGRGSSVAVVRVADRALVLGVTDTHVTLLSETDVAVVEDARTTTRRTPVTGAGAGADALAEPHESLAALQAGQTARPLDGRTPGDGPLAGSILSPQTWRRTVETLRERTVRK